jgi:hypothetical protein
VIYKRGFAVVNVSDNGNVAKVFSGHAGHINTRYQVPFLYARLRGPAAAMMFVEKDYKNNHETPAATHELQRPSASLVLQSSYSLFLTCVFGTTELHLCIQPAWRKLPPSLPLLLYRNHNAGISPA